MQKNYSFNNHRWEGFHCIKSFLRTVRSSGRGQYTQTQIYRPCDVLAQRPMVPWLCSFRCRNIHLYLNIYIPYFRVLTNLGHSCANWTKWTEVYSHMVFVEDSRIVPWVSTSEHTHYIMYWDNIGNDPLYVLSTLVFTSKRCKPTAVTLESTIHTLVAR